MKSDKDLLKQFKRHYDISKSGCNRQYRHIKECNAFYSGDYMNYRDQYAYGRGTSRSVKEVQFNRVKPYVNSIVGFMAQQRRKPDYQAKLPDQSDQIALSEYLNGFSDYCRENTNADQMETRQDKDMVIGGVGATDTLITLKTGNPTRDPNGETIVERVDPLEVGWDPNSVHPNLLDSRWVYRVKDYDLEEALELFNAEEEDFTHVSASDDDDINYEFNPYGGIQDKIGFEWSDASRNMVRVYFYQWFEVENFFRIENPILEADDPETAVLMAQALNQIEQDKTDDMFVFNPEAPTLVITKSNRRQIKQIFEMFGLAFDPIAEKRKVYYTALISGDKVFSKYKSVSQQGFSIKFKTGDRDETNKIWTGVVASMRDPQRYYNKALTELMIIIASNSRGGVMYESDAVENVQEFERNWARHNAAIRLNPGALTGGKIQAKAQPAMSTGYEGLVQASGDALSQVTGIDESFFGAIAGGNETAMLQRQRIKQATTILAQYFDSITLYSKEQARLMMSYMRLLAESMEGALFATQDANGVTVFERISLDFFADEYDVRIGEAPDTPTQKEYYTQTLISMGQSMQAIGDPRYLQIYAAAIMHMPLPERDKAKIVEILMGEQRLTQEEVQQIVQPLQAQIAQLQSEQVQLDNAKKSADIQKTTADTQIALVEARKKQAEIEKLIEDIEQVAIENDMLNLKGPQDVNVTI